LYEEEAKRALREFASSKYALSKRFSLCFRRYGGNPILDVGPSGAWDSKISGDPSVIKIGETYHMYYYGHDGADYRLGLAQSDDLLKWDKYADNPILGPGPSGSWDEGGCWKPSVVFNPADEKYYMFYTGRNPDGDYVIGVATSEDGLTWTKCDNNPLLADNETPGWAHAPEVVFYPEDKHWYMYYYNGNGVVKLARSPDLLSWTIQGKVLEGKDGEWDAGLLSPAVAYDEDLAKFIMAYNATSGGGISEPSRGCRTGLAIGDSPTKFTRHGVIIPLPAQCPATDHVPSMYLWEYDKIYAPALFKVGGEYWIFYNAKGLDGKERIGVTRQSREPVGEKYTVANVIDSGASGLNKVTITTCEPGREYKVESAHAYDWSNAIDGIEMAVRIPRTNQESVLRAVGSPSVRDPRAHLENFTIREDSEFMVSFYGVTSGDGLAMGASIIDRPVKPFAYLD